MSRESHYIRNSLRTAVVQAVVTALGVGLTMLSARFLGPGGKGALALLILFPVLSVTAGRLGIGNSVIYHAPRVPHAKLIFNGLVLISAVGTLASLIILPVILALRTSFFRGIPAGWLVWMCGMIVLFFLYDFLGSLFVALYQIGLRNALVILFPSAYLVFFILFVIAGGRRVGGAIGAWSLAVILAVAVSLFWLFRKAEWRGGKFDAGLIRDLVRFGVKSHWGMILEFLNYRADYFLLNLYSGPAAVGLYSGTINVAEALWKLPEAAALVLMPNAAKMPPDRARLLTQKICRVVLVFVLGSSVLLYLGRKPLILFVLGRAFLPSAEPLLILLPGFAAFALWKILAYGLLAQGHPKLYSLTSTLAFLIMVILDIVLIPGRGIVGAAWAHTAAYLAATAAVVVVYLRTSGSRLGELFLPRRSDLKTLAEYVGIRFSARDTEGCRIGAGNEGGKGEKGC